MPRKYTYLFNIWIHDDLRSAIRDRAKEMHITHSEWTRQALAKAALPVFINAERLQETNDKKPTSQPA